MEEGHLCFEYNLFIVERYKFKSEAKIPAGEHQILVKTTIPRPGAAATIVFTVDGKPMGELTANRTAPAAFTASETFDVGIDLGSTVSEAYSERRPFEFDGKIKTVNVEMN